jgi:peptidoglycan/xylan/chitin deacetylase (PgdA/CDA1 family)
VTGTSAIVRKGVKAAVLPFGLFRPRRRGDLVVLLYHRIGAGDREIDLPRRSFEHHLETLLAHDRVRSLDDAVSDDEGGVVLTFDDGYRDFYSDVLPLLVRYRVPGLLYLATGLVANGDARSIGPEAQLTWSMLQEAASTGLVTIGAHTHSHADLSSATLEDAEVEMRRSKELIEDRIGAPCRHFAYPWGVGSDGARRAAAGLFDTAALDSWRTNRRGALDPHRLGRTPVLRNDGRLFFRAKTLGLLDGEALAYRVLRRGPWRSPGANGVAR